MESYLLSLWVISFDMSFSFHFRWAELALVLLTGSLAAGADTAAFVLHQAVDVKGTGRTALTYLLPKDWTATDSVTWDLAQRTVPMQYKIHATSPDGQFVVHYLNETVNSYSIQPNHLVQGKAPPKDPTDLLVDFFKSTHAGLNVEILDRQSTPATSRFPSDPTSHSLALTCSVKLRYTVNGVTMLTKSGFDFDSYNLGTPWGREHGFINGSWYLINVTSISAPEEQFPEAMRRAAVLLSSRSYDPTFFQQYMEVCQMMLTEMQRENQARLDAQFKSIMSNFQNLSERNRQKFNEQMAAKDQHTRAFCDYVLDRHHFSDGATEFILPSGFTHAVTNGAEYVMTDDPNFRAAGNWRELRRAAN